MDGKKKSIMFIEVKLRKERAAIRAADAVGAAKQRRIRLSADLWLSANPEYLKYQISFAVAEVYVSDQGHIEKLNILDNAF